MSDKSLYRTGLELICFIICILLACSGTPNNFAGGVETTNGITVVAGSQMISGTAVPHSQIIICDTAYMVLQTDCFADTVYVDRNGNFTLGNLSDG